MWRRGAVLSLPRATAAQRTTASTTIRMRGTETRDGRRIESASHQAEVVPQPPQPPPPHTACRSTMADHWQRASCLQWKSHPCPSRHLQLLRLPPLLLLACLNLPRNLPRNLPPTLPPNLSPDLPPDLPSNLPHRLSEPLPRCAVDPRHMWSDRVLRPGESTRTRI